MRGCARRISRRAFRPTYLSGELNTSRPGERGSKALPRRPMRVDAASEPSARDAARGVIGLSAFANNRKGDARSADTCVVCASMDHARVSVSLSRSCVEYKWGKKYLHSIPCVVDRRSTIAPRCACMPAYAFAVGAGTGSAAPAVTAAGIGAAGGIDAGMDE